MYTAAIDRANPTMIMFLLDQSGSMQDVFEPTTKAQGLADAINRLLQNLCIKCGREDGVRDYLYVGVIGYGAHVGPAFGGNLSGRELVPISEVERNPARVETRSKKVISDGAGGLIDQEVKFRVWFDAVANGGTPMCTALNEVCRIVQGWLGQYPNCFPPIVINITDGESTDGDPTSAASNLRALRSSDGEVLLFNLHLSSQRNAPIEFPSSEAELPDQYARLLFQISSPLTAFMIGEAKKDGFKVTEGARGFAFNADLVAAIKFLDIGSKASNMR